MPVRPRPRRQEKLISGILGSFHLGDRESKGDKGFSSLRGKLDAAIDKLR